MKLRLANEKEIIVIYNMCELIKNNYPFWDEEYPIYDNFLESYNDDGLYVLQVERDIVGSICLEKGITNKYSLSLSRFMIHPNYRRKGYGKIIFELIEHEVIKKGYNNIEFFVHKDHPFAFDMYKGFGYTDKGLYKTEWDEDFPTYHLFTNELK